ncbi:MAG: hypothetical protein EOP06_09105 [Proteobacteria bacterium]|nr:MAG: hypothetical protein EOP06_09105 [Pseudomonadota bacterium]
MTPEILALKIPALVQVGFGLVVVFMLFAYLVTFHKVPFYSAKFRFVLLVWLAATGVLGTRRFFTDFESMPPRLPLFVLLFSCALFVLGYVIYRSGWLSRLQQFHLVLFQSFRIPVEILLMMLANAQLLPHEMTFQGQNFDIAIGLTALPLAWALYKSRKNPGSVVSGTVLMLWNWCGILMLTNVVLHGMLSAPYPFQVLKLEPATYVLGHFPVTWLPLFLVPTAYFFHIISLLKIRSDG